MEIKKLGLVVGSILFGGGVGMLSPSKGKFPAISLIIIGILIQMLCIKEEKNPIDMIPK